MIERFGSTKPVPNEPDFVKGWLHGMAYRIVRHPDMGHLCGYVKLPKGHPLLKAAKAGGYGMKGWGSRQKYGRKEHGYDAKALRCLSVHGGLTWSGHLPTRRGEGGYWLGFDCAHYGDLVPSLDDKLDGTYRTIEYVRKELDCLIQQVVG